MMLRILLMLSFGAALASAASWITMYQRKVRKWMIYGGVTTLEFAHKGRLVSELPGQSPDSCAKLCASVARCQSFQLTTGMLPGRCYLKSGKPTDPNVILKYDRDADLYFEKNNKDTIEKIMVEVSGQKNSEAKDAECDIKFVGTLPWVTFTDPGPGGSVLSRGQNMTFPVSGLPAGFVLAGLKVKCRSASNDALYLEKLSVFTNNGVYSGEVRTVFDDPATCNTAEITGLVDCSSLPLNKCCREKVVVSMVHVP